MQRSIGVQTIQHRRERSSQTTGFAHGNIRLFDGRVVGHVKLRSHPLPRLPANFSAEPEALAEAASVVEVPGAAPLATQSEPNKRSNTDGNLAQLLEHCLWRLAAQSSSSGVWPPADHSAPGVKPSFQCATEAFVDWPKEPRMDFEKVDFNCPRTFWAISKPLRPRDAR